MSGVSNTVVVIGIVLLFTCLGSFTSVVVARLPVELDEPDRFGDVYGMRPWGEVLGGRSECDHCGAAVPWYLNIPVLSWLALRGRCRSCGERIGVFHLFLEVLVPVAAIGIFAGVGRHWLLLPALALVPFGMAIAAIDLRIMMVPTVLVVPGSVVVVATSAIAAFGASEPRWLLGGLIGTATLTLPLFALWWFNPRGMGYGDVRLAIMLGWSMGFASMTVGGTLLGAMFATFVGLAMAAIVGLVGGLMMVGITRRPVPFGPALVVATFLCNALASQVQDVVRR